MAVTKRSINAVLFAAILLLGASSAHAQVGAEQMERSGGRLFVVAFPDTTMNTFDARYPNQAYVDKAQLFIYSAVDAKVSIKGPAGYARQLTTTGGRFTVHTVMGDTVPGAVRPIANEHCKPVDNTFRIESDQPIVLYQYLVTKFGTEAWAPVPVEGWGVRYFAAAHQGEIGSDVSPGGEFDYKRRNKSFPAEILVIAAYDDTRITIVPNGQVHLFCRAENVNLKAGQAYQIQSYVDTLTANVGGDQPDFAGSRIFATKPVGVITGNTRAQLIDENVGLGKNCFKNMLIEWLTPVEQHGTEFVYMPTWDSRRPTGAPSEDPSERRRAEFVRVYSTTDTTSSTYSDTLGNHVSTGPTADLARFTQTRLKPSAASVFRSSLPAQVMMSSASVVRYAGTIGGNGGYIGAAYEGWGGYMVELTPREQWVSFAPYYASEHPSGMVHFINVVTDTAHRNDVYLRGGARFPFTRPIAGTDLIWGSMSVTPGADHHLEGRNGATFGGFVYGTLDRGGYESYLPGAARGRDDEPPASVGGGIEGDPEILHPSEYREALAISYGYPLAPSRLVSRPGDSLGVTTRTSCAGMCVDASALNDDPAGLRTIILTDTVNATITSLNPVPLTGAMSARVCVGPVDSLADASATVVITDKTGRVTRVPFTYRVDRIVSDSARLNFGVVKPGSSVRHTFTVTNPLDRAVSIAAVDLLLRSPGFTIVEPTSFPITLPAGATVRVVVQANPLQPDTEYQDVVAVRTTCFTVTVPIAAETFEPCIEVGNLDFGVMQPGESRTRALRISNDGGGVVSFVNPVNGPLIEWLDTSFAIVPTELGKLSSAKLSRGMYIDIAVTFAATDTGRFVTTARIWASVRNCRDTSVWTAHVTPPASAPSEGNAVLTLDVAQPNPVTSTTTIRFTLPRAGLATLVLYDERGARIETLVDETRAAGPHEMTLDASSLPAGVYHYRLGTAGASIVRSFVRK